MTSFESCLTGLKRGNQFKELFTTYYFIHYMFIFYLALGKNNRKCFLPSRCFQSNSDINSRGSFPENGVLQTTVQGRGWLRGF